jgi:hypothetical protein
LPHHDQQPSNDQNQTEHGRMLPSNMLLLNLILLIDVTFSTPTRVYNNHRALQFIITRGDMPSPHRIAPKAALIIIGLIVSGSIDPASAGIRAPGKYSGVVIFDRWDTCLLVSGPYVTYISENVKGGLRQYAGMAVQIDASEVIQPINPGDALVRNYELLGLAPDVRDDPVKLDGLFFRVEGRFQAEGSPVFIIDIHNSGSADTEIRTDEVGITLLGNHRSPLSPSDGPSEAVITRAPLSGPYGSGSWEYGGESFHASLRVDGRAIPPHIRLKAGESRAFRVRFDVSPGEYQFIVGYGGGVHQGRSLVSNAISFDVDRSGTATLVK